MHQAVNGIELAADVVVLGVVVEILDCRMCLVIVAKDQLRLFGPTARP